MDGLDGILTFKTLPLPWDLKGHEGSFWQYASARSITRLPAAIVSWAWA